MLSGVAGFFYVPIANAASSFTQNIFSLGGPNNQQITPISPAYTLNQVVAPPLASGTATTSGSLAIGQLPLYLSVVAITPGGTTTPSNEIATTTAKSLGEAIHLTIAPVPGAIGYALYFGTTTPLSENAYFATTTTSMTLTSTSSPTAYGAPPTFTTAFGFQTASTSPFASFNGRPYQFLATTSPTLASTALSAGNCASVTAGFFNSSLGSTTVVLATPQSDPATVAGPDLYWKAIVVTPTTVKISLCNASSTAITSNATAFNIIAL